MEFGITMELVELLKIPVLLEFIAETIITILAKKKKKKIKKPSFTLKNLSIYFLIYK
jgi:hypothetical protein